MIMKKKILHLFQINPKTEVAKVTRPILLKNSTKIYNFLCNFANTKNNVHGNIYLLSQRYQLINVSFGSA